jgi:hypothetical protein
MPECFRCETDVDADERVWMPEGFACATCYDALKRRAQSLR